MPEFVSQILLLAYGASLMWMIVVAFGLRRETFRDRTNVDVSWRRTWKPALLAALCAATGLTLMPGAPRTWQQVAEMWLIMAVIFTPACFASGAIMMAIARWHRRIEIRRRERLGFLPGAQHIEQARQGGRVQG